MLLAIDTATRMLSLALHDGTRLLAESTHHTANRHTIDLAPLMQTMLRGQGLVPGDLRAVAIAGGPGSYSGLRVGFGVAKGLCLVHGLPLIAVPTLDIFAYATPAYPEPLLVSIPAGRRRILAGGYTWRVDAWHADGPPQNTTWAELVETLEAPVRAVGEYETPPQHPLVKPLGAAWAVRRAGFLAQMAVAHLEDDLPDASEVNPFYLKAP